MNLDQPIGFQHAGVFAACGLHERLLEFVAARLMVEHALLKGPVRPHAPPHLLGQDAAGLVHVLRELTPKRILQQAAPWSVGTGAASGRTPAKRAFKARKWRHAKAGIMCSRGTTQNWVCKGGNPETSSKHGLGKNCYGRGVNGDANGGVGDTVGGGGGDDGNGWHG